MTRRTRARLAACATLTWIALAGCSSDDTSTDGAASVSSGGRALHVVATLDVKGAFSLVPTADRLWVISGGTGEVTQVDPSSNTVSKVVRLPHPAAYATLSHGSLWLVSFFDNALMQVDVQTGRVLRTFERSRSLPLSEPVGIAATGHDLWVVNHVSGRLLRIDARTGRATHTTSLDGHAAGGPVLLDGSLWASLTKEGVVDQVDPTTGEVVGRAIPVDTGLCGWGSVVGTDIWYTSEDDPTGVFNCSNGTSRVDATSREVSPLEPAAGMSLYTFTRYAGSLWATDSKRTIYEVDEDTGALRRALTLPGKRDSNHLFTAFGSMWVTRSGTGELLRLESS